MKVIVLDARGLPLISAGEELVNVAEICRWLKINRNTFNSIVKKLGSVEAAIQQVKKKQK
ncbi:hypothetical protein [Serratia proteamaculans]|uniref:hypothetical protein n=1 Tax=Serratia proteamaculans TaxID=28151 RepID=UPI00102231EF|nr:hypothetical protein [Serratia proteamaculans]RYM54805.1 hypothetical protein BSQ97_01795 [Serratia proteamaculans]